ncbi:hypothetical protein B4168_2982 [Anoxybacillus flavithermus]|nr:hypothetical protein B4168_2982 [Anoxybacillus flavithermus]OAO86271.1 hypothetical protein GT23_2164 [Parageobacillus thermoglucosidasius]
MNSFWRLRSEMKFCIYLSCFLRKLFYTYIVHYFTNYSNIGGDS